MVAGSVAPFCGASPERHQAGLSFNSALLPVSVQDEISGKSLPPTHSFCSFQGTNLVISALKKADADGLIILRLYEIQGTKAETPVSFLGKEQKFQEINLFEEGFGLNGSGSCT